MPVGAGSAGPEGEGATNVSSNRPGVTAHPVSYSKDAHSAPLSTPGNPEAREQEGLRVNFVINDRELAILCMDPSRISSQDHGEDIVAFQNFARGVSERCYGYTATTLSEEQFFALGGTREEEEAFLSQMQQSSEFGKIRQQTEEYLEVVRAQWQRNYPQAFQAIQEMTGLDLNKQITVNVIHPSLNTGLYRGNNTVRWGHHEDWNNYSTVYLWHEILHSYMDYTNLSHALIQLVTDNELRVKLNRGETYPPFYGYKDLISLMDKILPYWRTFLAEIPEGGKRNLLDLEERLRSMTEFREEKPKEPETKIIE